MSLYIKCLTKNSDGTIVVENLSASQRLEDYSSKLLKCSVYIVSENNGNKVLTKCNTHIKP